MATAMGRSARSAAAAEIMPAISRAKIVAPSAIRIAGPTATMMAKRTAACAPDSSSTGTTRCSAVVMDRSMTFSTMLTIAQSTT